MTLAAIEKMLAELSKLADDPALPDRVLEEILVEVQKLEMERNRLRALAQAH